MEPKEPAAALYDFLYRDTGRITSYYAQIFGGHLTALEEVDGRRDNVTTGAKGSIGVVGADATQVKEVSVSARRLVQPHDVTTVDVLSRLVERATQGAEAAEARHGELILAQGTLVFIDSSMLEMAKLTVRISVDEEKKKPRNQRNQDLIGGLTAALGFLDRMAFPSAFLLQDENGTIFGGTIKENGMEEPIATYYFKHGSSGLARVNLIGIKEIPTSSFALDNAQMMGAGKEAAQALSDFLFPSDAVRVTPIALFREIG